MIIRQQKNKDKFFEFLDKTINPKFPTSSLSEYKDLDKKRVDNFNTVKKFSEKRSKAE